MSNGTLNSQGHEVMSQEEVKLLNATVFEKLASRDPMMVKQAEDVVSAFTRTKMREDGFYRRVIPMVPITNDQLVRQHDTEKPVYIVDKEADSPAAISIGFATLPQNLYIRANRYKVPFWRITTSRFTKDVDDLRTWIMDIRQVVSDNAVKDMLAEEDGKFLQAHNSAIVGANMVVPASGVVQYEQIPGGISRDSLWDGLKVMPNTPSSLEVHTCLVNHITIKDVCKFGDDEQGGGGISSDIMKNGWTLKNYMGCDWIITIKKSLVPTNSIFQYADPAFIGKSYVLEDTTMYVRREAYLLEFYAYELIGGAIGNTSGLARIDYI